MQPGKKLIQWLSILIIVSDGFYWVYQRMIKCLLPYVLKGAHACESAIFMIIVFLKIWILQCKRTYLKNQIELCIHQIAHWNSENGGPDFQTAPIRFDIVNDEYGNESYEARIYYRGPLEWGGSPRVIRIHITRQEIISLPAVNKILHHPYSDNIPFQGIELVCNSLEEILAEKLRAISGQRRYAISRDLYDISNLRKVEIDLQKVKKILPEKFHAKGIPLSKDNLSVLETKKFDFQKDWDRRLSYLVHTNKNDFENTWIDVIQIFSEVLGE